MSSSSTIHHGDNTDKGTLILSVRVLPSAAKNEIVGVEEGTLKVRVTAPPVKGKANEALVKLLAKTFRVRKTQIEIVSGHKAQRKMVKVEGVEESAICDLPQRRQGKE
jgi:uncharacterized protein (TIGR00251 family)